MSMNSRDKGRLIYHYGYQEWVEIISYSLDVHGNPSEYEVKRDSGNIFKDFRRTFGQNTLPNLFKDLK